MFNSKIIRIFNNKISRENEVKVLYTFLIICICFIMISIFANAFLVIKLRIENSNKKELELIISEKNNKIKVLFENMERLSGYKIRVDDLEDDINKLHKIDVRNNITYIENPLSNNDLKVIRLLINEKYKTGGFNSRKDIEIYMEIENSLNDIIKNHSEYKSTLQSQEKIKKDKNKPMKKNNINTIGKTN